MTDRIKGLTVTLEDEYRIDDLEDGLIKAIYQMKGVLNVVPHVSDYNHHMAKEQIKMDLSKKLWDVLHPEHKGKL